MSTPITPSFAQLQHLSVTAGRRAATGLSQLLDRDIDVTSGGVVTGSVSDLYERLGGEDATVAAIYLQISGDLTGHIMLLFPERNALEMADLLLEEPLGTTQEFDEMTLSAIGEVGNITGAAFLNTYSDSTGLTIHPSPPVTIVDMAGALVNSLLAEVEAQGAEVGIIETMFHDADSVTKGVVLIAPQAAEQRSVRGAA